MANAVTSRRDGDDFQARMFWMHAVKLLDGDSPVLSVGFEVGPSGFDDIWVEYSPGRGPQDVSGRPLVREHIQCKWHVSPSLRCEMCESQDIRYVHYMAHPSYPEVLGVGCICGGHMEGDLAASRHREAGMKSRSAKRRRWLSRAWKTSQNGNPYTH